jgi:hypothetical protein
MNHKPVVSIQSAHEELERGRCRDEAQYLRLLLALGASLESVAVESRCSRGTIRRVLRGRTRKMHNWAQVRLMFISQAERLVQAQREQLLREKDGLLEELRRIETRLSDLARIDGYDPNLEIKVLPL